MDQDQTIETDYIKLLKAAIDKNEIIYEGDKEARESTYM